MQTIQLDSLGKLTMIQDSIEIQQVSINMIILLIIFFFHPTAICAPSCQGNCLVPGECYCYPGFNGVNCDIPVNPVLVSNAGVGICSYSDVTTQCILGMYTG